MAEERIDIEVTDKVDPSAAKKLRDIAAAALDADSAIDRLKASLTQLDASAVDRMASASAKLTNATAKEINAQARLEAARAKTAVAGSNAALAAQRLATEQARTEAATERAAAASARARVALIAEENASLRLAAAKAREAAAQDIANGAATRAAGAAMNLTRQSGLAAHQTSNLVFQIQDVIVGLQAGQAPLTVLLQQGTQIASVFGPGTGVIGILRGVVQAAGAMLAPFLPVIAVVGVIAAGFGILTHEINKTTDVAVEFGDVVKAAFQLIGEAIYTFVKPAIDFLAPYIQKAYDFIIDATKLVVNGIVGAFVGTYNAVVGTWDMLPAVWRDIMALSINGLIDVINAGVGGILNYFRDFINKTVGLFVGGFNAVKGVWGLLPDAFHDLGVAAMNGLITVVESGINGLVKAVGDFLEWLGSAFEAISLPNPFAGLLDGDVVDLSQYRGELRGAGTQIATTISGAFNEAFSRDYAEGMRDALDLSGYRQEVTGAARDAAGVVANAYRDAFATDYAGGAFAAIRERSIQLARERIAAEAEAEAGAAGARQASNASLETKKKLLEEIQKPLTEYRENTAALNELLAEGAITLGQYNEALASLSLVASLREVDSSLTGTPFADSAAIDEIRIAEQERLNVVQQALEARIISEEEAAARVVEINRKASQEILDIEYARKSMMLQNASSLFGSLAEAAKGFAGEQSGIYKALFIASKAFAIADSIIKIQQGIANALALPFPANLAAAATVAAQAASIVSNIQAVQFADGGYVSGPGGPRDDKILAKVSNGEFVVNAAATARNRPLLEAINSGNDQVRYRGMAYADGGEVQAAYRPSAITPRVGNEVQTVQPQVSFNVYTRDPDTRIEPSRSQQAARTARAVNYGQRNL